MGSGSGTVIGRLNARWLFDNCRVLDMLRRAGLSDVHDWIQVLAGAGNLELAIAYTDAFIDLTKARLAATTDAELALVKEERTAVESGLFTLVLVHVFEQREAAEAERNTT